MNSKTVINNIPKFRPGSSECVSDGFFQEDFSKAIDPEANLHEIEIRDLLQYLLKTFTHTQL